MAPSTSAAVRMLCYGDSLTAGYCGTPNLYCPYAKQLSQKLNVQVDHVGLSGLRADEMVANLNNSCCFDIFHKCGPGLAVQLAQHKYAYCILMAGTNDLGFNRSADDIIADLKQLHQQCHARGVRTIALSIPESQFTAQNGFSMPAFVRQQVNQKLSAWAATQSKTMMFIDMASQLPFSPFTGDWAADGLHLTHQGYTRFGSHLAKLLQQYLPSASQAAPKKVPLADATNTATLKSSKVDAASAITTAAFGAAPVRSPGLTKGASTPKVRSNSKPAALASTSYPTTLNFGKPSSWTMGEYFFPNYANFGTTLLTADNSGLAGSISPPVTSVPYTEASTFSSWQVLPQTVM